MSEGAQPDAIRVEGLGKKYLLQTRAGRTVKSVALDWLRRQGGERREFWALKEVSFVVPKGETLGIVGANGAGKSTLLALLAGTKLPSQGKIETHGSISSLLELGAGFHPELTGRENVYLAGAVMGISRATMAERFDAIVEFAELQKFIDQPVKHYSSGMYVRLGFAVAVEVDPDVLLLDEVLSVGDLSFQQRCLDRMEQFRLSNKTMLIISHDLNTIKEISDRILFLEEGCIMGLGDPATVVDSYHSRVRAGEAKGLSREWGTGEVLITAVEILNREGEPRDEFSFGDELVAHIHYDAKQRIELPVFGFSIADAQGRLVYGNNTQLEGPEVPMIEGAGRLKLHIHELLMGQGTYLLSFSVHSSDHKTNFHRLDYCFPITLRSEKAFEGAYMPVRWDHQPSEGGTS